MKRPRNIREEHHVLEWKDRNRRRQRPRLTELLAKVAAPDSEPPPPALPDEDLVNGLAQYLEVDPTERQELLELKDLVSRSQALIDLLEERVGPPR